MTDLKKITLYFDFVYRVHKVQLQGNTKYMIRNKGLCTKKRTMKFYTFIMTSDVSNYIKPGSKRTSNTFLF